MLLHQALQTLAPATYMVWVRDANGCTDSTQVVIDEPAPISIPNVVDSVVCFGTSYWSSGRITASWRSFSLLLTGWGSSAASRWYY